MMQRARTRSEAKGWMGVDPEILGRLYRQHGPPLLLFARQLSTTPEDIVHDAFVKLARQSSLPDQPANWLYRVVRNESRMAYRHQQRRSERERKATAPEAWLVSLDDPLDARLAVAALQELSVEEREVVVARIWGGRTFEEIAKIVETSLPTAHRRYHQALTAIRAKMGLTDEIDDRSRIRR